MLGKMDYITKHGFVMVSNLIIEYQQELGITDVELAFIIKIMKNRNGYILHDKDLDPTVCSKTLARRRAALKNKGIIKYAIAKKQNPETGKFVTWGVEYDLSPLEEKLIGISNKLQTAEAKKRKEQLAEEKIIIEEPDSEKKEEETPLNKFMDDYEEFYGIKYKIKKEEIERYNRLSEENKKMIAFIFEYAKEERILSKVTISLSLFFKTPFRMAGLKKFCLKNSYLDEEEHHELELEDYSDEVFDIYEQYLSKRTIDNQSDRNFYNDLDVLIYRFHGCEDYIKRNAEIIYKRYF